MLNWGVRTRQGVVGRGNSCLGTAYPLGKHEREKEIGFYFWKLCLLYYSFPGMDCFDCKHLLARMVRAVGGRPW